jgi:hypothetical protein
VRGYILTADKQGEREMLFTAVSEDTGTFVPPLIAIMINNGLRDEPKKKKKIGGDVTKKQSNAAHR